MPDTTTKRTFVPQRRERKKFVARHIRKQQAAAGPILLQLAESAEDPEVKNALLLGAAGIGFKPAKKKTPAPEKPAADGEGTQAPKPAAAAPLPIAATPVMLAIIAEHPQYEAALREISARTLPAIVRISQMRAYIASAQKELNPS